MNKERFSASAFVLALLVSVVAGTLFVNLGRANPYMYYEHVPPPADTKPPTITILSPENKSYAANNVFLTFNVSIRESKNTDAITEVYYKADWQESNTSVYYLDMVNDPYYYEHWITEFSYNLNLTGIPEGNHSIVINAGAIGSYASDLTAYYFDIGGSSSVNFTIDITSPSISILSPQNKTYETSDVPLDFTINEPFSQITYSLDGQGNVTIAENRTLIGLSDGVHNVTVYAWDNAGNIGASETIYFSIKTQQSSLPMEYGYATVAVIVVAIAPVVGYLFLKRKK